jgi:Mrp family chromosome partitioning ATPase
LPSGSSDVDPTTLLTPARVQPRLKELGARFENVLICAPPADLYAESVALGRIVDGVVLVVSANATRRDAVARVKSRFDDLGVSILGVVLNDRRYPIPQSLYRRI